MLSFSSIKKVFVYVKDVRFGWKIINNDYRKHRTKFQFISFYDSPDRVKVSSKLGEKVLGTHWKCNRGACTMLLMDIYIDKLWEVTRDEDKFIQEVSHTIAHEYLHDVFFRDYFKKAGHGYNEEYAIKLLGYQGMKTR